MAQSVLTGSDRARAALDKMGNFEGAHGSSIINHCHKRYHSPMAREKA